MEESCKGKDEALKRKKWGTPGECACERPEQAYESVSKQ